MARRRKPEKLALKHLLAQQRDERESLKAVGASKGELDALKFRHWTELEGGGAVASVPAWALGKPAECSDTCPPCCMDCGQGHDEDTPTCSVCE